MWEGGPPAEEDLGSEVPEWELKECRKREEELGAGEELPLFLPTSSSMASADDEEQGTGALFFCPFLSVTISFVPSCVFLWSAFHLGTGLGGWMGNPVKKCAAIVLIGWMRVLYSQGGRVGENGKRMSKRSKYVFFIFRYV